MSTAAAMLKVLTLGNAEKGLAAFIQRIFFAITYNTTTPVNTIIALGSITPYLIYLLAHGELTVAKIILAVALTLLSAYFYSLIYIINDYIDREKDKAKNIPKFTAHHILGRHYLLIAPGGFLISITTAGLLWPHAFPLVLAYALALCLLSLIHSHWRTGKALTIFVERLAKFCSPLWLISIVSGDPFAVTCLVGALIVYPLGFTMDYAYRGYVRDRLQRPAGYRFILYGLYWLLILADVAASYHFDLLPLAESIEYYLGGYLLITGLAAVLARFLPMPFLNNHYDSHVAGEKRRLLTYALVQVVIISGTLVYAIFA